MDDPHLTVSFPTHNLSVFATPTSPQELGTTGCRERARREGLGRGRVGK